MLYTAKIVFYCRFGCTTRQLLVIILMHFFTDCIYAKKISREQSYLRLNLCFALIIFKKQIAYQYNITSYKSLIQNITIFTETILFQINDSNLAPLFLKQVFPSIALDTSLKRISYFSLLYPTSSKFNQTFTKEVVLCILIYPLQNDDFPIVNQIIFYKRNLIKKVFRSHCKRSQTKLRIEPVKRKLVDYSFSFVHEWIMQF